MKMLLPNVASTSTTAHRKCMHDTTLTISLATQWSNRQLGLGARPIGVTHGNLADRQVLFIYQETRIFSPAWVERNDQTGKRISASSDVQKTTCILLIHDYMLTVFISMSMQLFYSKFLALNSVVYREEGKARVKYGKCPLYGKLRKCYSRINLNGIW